MPERFPFVQGHVVGPVALDLVLRIVRGGVVDVTLTFHVSRVNAHDPAADPAGLRVPPHAIALPKGSHHGAGPSKNQAPRRPRKTLLPHRVWLDYCERLGAGRVTPLDGVKNFDARDASGEELPVLSWVCYLCGEKHVSNVPVGTRGNRLIVVTCPETGEKRRVIAVPFVFLSR